MGSLLWFWEAEEMKVLERRNAVVTGGRGKTRGRRLPVVFRLDGLAAAARARREVRRLADELGMPDAEAIELVAGEMAANCVEHRTGMTAARLRVTMRGGRLSVETWNRCRERPVWRTAKNRGDTVYRVGGHGLVLCRVLALHFRRTWVRRGSGSFVRARAEFRVQQ